MLEPACSSSPRPGRARSPSSAAPATRRCWRRPRRCTTRATARGVDAERAVLAGLGGSCNVPLGAYAEANGRTLRLWGFVGPAGRLAHGARPRRRGRPAGRRRASWPSSCSTGAGPRCRRGERRVAGPRPAAGGPARARHAAAGAVRGAGGAPARAGRRGRRGPAGRDRAARGPAAARRRAPVARRRTTGSLLTSANAVHAVADATTPRGAGLPATVRAGVRRAPRRPTPSVARFPGRAITAQATEALRRRGPGRRASPWSTWRGARMLFPVSDRSPAALAGRSAGARGDGRGRGGLSDDRRRRASAERLRAALDAGARRRDLRISFGGRGFRASAGAPDPGVPAVVIGPIDRGRGPERRIDRRRHGRRRHRRRARGGGRALPRRNPRKSLIFLDRAGVNQVASAS